MKVRFKKLSANAVLPKYAKEGDAGMDLVATTPPMIKYGENPNGENIKFIQFGTGLAVEIPKGYVGLLFPRSSITKKDLMLKNSIGVIDSGYRGEILLRFKALKPLKEYYKKEERIAQLLIMPIPTIEPEWAEELDDSDRGQGGFGSTGK